MNEEVLSEKQANYNGMLEFGDFSGEAGITIEDEGFICDTLFDQKAVIFADIEAISFDDYIVQITANGEKLSISRMEQIEEFHKELTEKYNKKILKVLNIKDKPDLESEGCYAFDGKEGIAQLKIFPDSFCILPFNKNARRIPLVFINAMKKQDYALTMSLSTGESYEFSMLGYDFEPIVNRLMDNIRAVREKGRVDIEGLSPMISFAESAKAAMLLSEGVAAPLKSLPENVADALDVQAKDSEMDEGYDMLKALGDDRKLAVGIKKVESGNIEWEDEQQWIVWAVIPAEEGEKAIVEIAYPDHSPLTYIFKTGGNFDAFLLLLNRGMEAAKLDCKIFEADLKNNKDSDLRMLADRTPAIKTLRNMFLGRADHDEWADSVLSLIERKVVEVKEEVEPPQKEEVKVCSECGTENPPTGKFCNNCGNSLAVIKVVKGKCPSCGTQNPPHVKFCGECGTRL